MADIQVQQRGGGKTWLWAALALIAVVALMAWLAVQSEEAATAAAEAALAAEAAEAAEAEEQVVTEVALADLVAGAATHEGRRVAVPDAQVTGTLGGRAALTSAGGGTPLLLLFPEGTSPALGETYQITGRFGVVSDSVLAVWTEQGAADVSPEQLPGTTHFVDIAEAAPAGPSAAAPPGQQP